jgi:hypothetical protein
MSKLTLERCDVVVAEGRRLIADVGYSPRSRRQFCPESVGSTHLHLLKSTWTYVKMLGPCTSCDRIREARLETGWGYMRWNGCQ